jgi:hypothetical protein
MPSQLHLGIYWPFHVDTSAHGSISIDLSSTQSMSSWSQARQCPIAMCISFRGARRMSKIRGVGFETSSPARATTRCGDPISLLDFLDFRHRPSPKRSQVCSLEIIEDLSAEYPVPHQGTPCCARRRFPTTYDAAADLVRPTCESSDDRTCRDNRVTLAVCQAA